MDFLLDTNAVIWFFKDDNRLSKSAKDAIFDLIPEVENPCSFLLVFHRPASLPKLAWHKAMLRFVALHGSKNPAQHNCQSFRPRV